MAGNSFAATAPLDTASGEYTIYRLAKLEEAGLTKLDRLPFSIRVLLESVLRQENGREVTEQDVKALAGWKAQASSRPDVPFLPARVIMQDFTGVPAIVDLAAMRSALARLGGDPAKINPRVPVDLVIDHSVQVDFYGTQQALRRNAEMEFERNRERYEFLRWGVDAFERFRVVPPATGIVHQVNLEFLGQVVMSADSGEEKFAFPDTLVGTDSHTTMINGLGILGWGVGGIEAEATMLGQPMMFPAPDVVGFRMVGALNEGATATDLVLRVTEILRDHGVVAKFVEFFGPGLSELSLPDRATLSNMSPEYGATVGFFPVDDETLRYMRLTGRPDELIDLVERYCKEQGLFRTTETPDPEYTEVLELDLSTVEPSLAGPKRPQDRVALSNMRGNFEETLLAPTDQGGFALDPALAGASVSIDTNGTSAELAHGSVVIAAITSCTNTSNPMLMVAAGLLARNALERGLTVPPFVKTSMAPGSTVVTEYLTKSGLLEPLADLGFDIVGYGCTTCIGNSGPLDEHVAEAVMDQDLVASAVLSGNRNFEGRIHPLARASYLASPPLVVAYALAGTTNINLNDDPLGETGDGEAVYLKDIWPSQEEVRGVVEQWVGPDMFRSRYADVFSGNPTWNDIKVRGGDQYAWDDTSTYIQEPPFFVDLTPEVEPITPIHGARVLALLGNTVTTDHISPAGAIPADSPAGAYLIRQGVQVPHFNSFGSRRGNDQVMTRGTFGNIRLKNLLVPGSEGNVTQYLPDGKTMSIFEAAMKYEENKTPLIVLAGGEYGTGSSRDWAAKGTALLGVKAVIAESYERIHRSNLVGMGVLPLQFEAGESIESLGLTGHETYDIEGLDDEIGPGSKANVVAHRDDGSTLEFNAVVRLETPIETEYYRNGGILHTVLRQMLG